MTSGTDPNSIAKTMMKNTMLYVAVGVGAMALSTSLSFFFAKTHRESDEIDANRTGINYQDVRDAVEETILDHQLARLSNDDTKSGRYLAEVTASLAEIRRQQDRLVERLGKIADDGGKPASGAAAVTLSLPEQTRIEEIVASTIVAQQEKEAADRRERNERRDREASEARRKSVIADLKTSLSLTGDQVPRVELALAEADKARQELMNFRRDGGEGLDLRNADWQGMRESFTNLEKKVDESMQGILSSDQFTKYKETQPFNLGRRMGGFGGGGGDGGGRNRGAGQGDAAAPGGAGSAPVDPATGQPQRRGNRGRQE